MPKFDVKCNSEETTDTDTNALRGLNAISMIMIDNTLLSPALLSS
jgi:hypothetical protein